MLKIGNSVNILNNNLIEEINKSKAKFNYRNAIFFAELLVQESTTETNKIILAECYISNGNFEKSYIILKGIKKLNGKYLYAFTCYKLSKLDEAKDILSNFEGNSADWYYLLGLVLEELSQINDALENYKKSLKIDNNLWVAYEKILLLEDINIMKSFTDYDKKNGDLMFNQKKDICNLLFKKDFNRNDEIVMSSTKIINRETYNRNKDRPGKQILNINTNSLKKKDFYNSKKKILKEENLFTSNVLTKYLRILCKPLFYLENYEIKKCLRIIEELPNNFKNLSFIILIKARCYMIIGENKKAYDYFIELKNNIIPLKGLDYFSSCLYLLNKEEDLFELLIENKDICNNLPEFWILMGNYESMNKNIDTSINFFKRAINLKPYYTYAKCLLALEYFNKENYEKSEDLYNNVIKYNPKFYLAYWGLGNINQRKSDYIISKFYFEKAIKINEDNPYLCSFLGDCYNSMGDYTNSLKYYDKANSMKKDNLILIPMSKILIDINQIPKAINILEELLKHNPFDSEIYFNIGMAYKKLENNEKAIQNFDKCLDLNHQNSTKIKSYIDIIMRDPNNKPLIEEEDYF